MENIIKIGTVNLQNNKINRNGGLSIDDGIDRAKLIANHIEKEEFDILGTQELTRLFSTNIASNLNKYKLYGGYRYGNGFIGKKIKFISDFNENNAIITKHKVLVTETQNMPFIPNNIKDLTTSIVKGSIMPRIVTVSIIDMNGKSICVMNTHLDYAILNVQVKQLNYIKGLIKKFSKYYQVVLTGDFNMELGIDNGFDDFVKALDNFNIKRVSINDKTNADKFLNETAIDHIFIPSTWEILETGINEIKDVTDHKEIYVKSYIK